ncbi:DUF4440 domain-containing protein [Allobranchiibius sp. CTAmp26]|nr:DUF4440 domain-containing protein [Allobranchiibius sp. CTAmp26]MBO1756911.1 DUF4440 domain-containing protein [Allobranchiibius sp. CTAmp26]
MTLSTRSNGLRVRELLHEDFVEIGRSGRRWTRDELMASIAEDGEYEAPGVSEWVFVQMSRELMLVTYLATAANQKSRHASLWDIGAESPQMRFHQGTIVPGGQPAQ